MKAALLILLLALAALMWIWVGGGRGSGLAPATAAPAQSAASEDAAFAAAHAEQPGQLDLPALETAAAPLPREEAVLGDPSQTIRGRVLTLSGGPASGAEVSLWTLPEERGDIRQQIGAEAANAVHTVADEQGQFQFKNLSLPRYGLTADKGNRRQYHFPATPGQYLEIRLGDSGTVRGQLECKLHDAENFTGVAAIQGGWFEAGYGAVPIRADGSFELEFVPVGSTSLQVVVEDHDHLSSSRVEIQRPGETVDLLIKLEPACTVRGKVVDVVTRAPIAGAFVRGGSSFDGTGTRTGADGTFTLTGVPMASAITFFESVEPAMHTIDAEASGYLDGSIELTLSADERKPQEHTCTIALYAGIPVSGRILDPRGRPLPGLRLTLTQGPSFLSFSGVATAPDYRMHGRTDAEGRFTLAWGANRPTLLRVSSERYGEWSRNLGQIAGGRDLGDLQMPDPGSIPVLIVDDAGSPIPDADLRLSAKRNKNGLELAAASPPDSAWFQADYESVSTDAAGRCALLRPAAFPAEISVTIPYGVQDWEFPLPSRAADNQEDLRLTLKGLRTLTGRVQHANKSAVHAYLTVRHADDPTKKWNLIPKPDGSFRARASFPDRFDALVCSAGPERVGVVSFPGLQYSSQPLNLSLPEFLPVSGTVVDENGRPVNEANLHVFMLGEQVRTRCYTDATGRFRIWLPPEGAIELAATNTQGVLLLFDEGGKRVAVAAGQSGIVLVAPEPKKR